MSEAQEFKLLNGLALAYVGDAIYEIAIRDYLIRRGYTKPNRLHREATNYVSARSQAKLMQGLLAGDMLSEEELTMYKRGRNAKSHTTAKNADVTTYRVATGFESLFGYLHLTGQEARLSELVNWCIEKVGAGKNE